MSISIMWRLVKPSEAQSAPGTSNDWEVFQTTFPDRTIRAVDVPLLRAMHLIGSGPFKQETLWGHLADAIEGCPPGFEIEVWGEW